MRAAKRSGVQPQLFQVINMDALVPERHILRRLDETLDLSALHQWTAPLYSEKLGRPAADSEIMLRLMLLCYLFNHSERQLYQTLPMHAGYLWFCGLDFESIQHPDTASLRLPDRTTLVKTRKLWREHGVLDKLMKHVVDQCIAAGLVKTNVDAAVDGTQVRANVSIHSLEDIQVAPVESIEEYLARQAVEDKDDEVELSSTDKQDPPPPPTRESAPGLMEQAIHEDFHGKTFSNDTHRSTSDPDSRLYKKSAGQEAHPRFLVHDVVDVRSGVILDRRASRASGTAEREVSLQQLAAIRFRHPSITIRTLSADKAYGTKEYLAGLRDLGITSLVSLKSLTLEAEPIYKQKSHKLKIQAKRANKVRLIRISNEAKQIQIHGGYRYVQRMRVRCEHVFAEAKNVHGMDRANGRGLDRMQEQATWTAIVQNLKRLCRFKKNRPVAGSSVCANPTVGIAQELTTNALHKSNSRFIDFCNRWIWSNHNFSPDF